MTAPSVTKKTDGDRVILSLAGPWIVGAGKALETGAASLMSEVGGAKSRQIFRGGQSLFMKQGARFSVRKLIEHRRTNRLVQSAFHHATSSVVGTADFRC